MSRSCRHTAIAGKIAHRESKTFSDRKMATGWVEKREKWGQSQSMPIGYL